MMPSSHRFCSSLVALALALGCGDKLPLDEVPVVAIDVSNADISVAPDSADVDAPLDTGPAWGLDERPANPTCLAPPKPPVSDLVGLVPAYPGTSFEEPTAAAFAPGLAERVYVVGKEGFLWWAEPDVAGATVALDLTARVVYEADMGLVGLAFDPEFTVTGAVYFVYNLLCEVVVFTGALGVCSVLG